MLHALEGIAVVLAIVGAMGAWTAAMVYAVDREQREQATRDARAHNGADHGAFARVRDWS